MRMANDMGFECLLLEDCCGATDPTNHAAAVEMVKKQVRRLMFRQDKTKRDAAEVVQNLVLVHGHPWQWTTWE